MRPKTSPLGTRLCERVDSDNDHVGLPQDCMLHHYNDYCLNDRTTIITPRTCRVTRGTESVRGNADTSRFILRDTAAIVVDNTNIKHFQMRRKKSEQLVQHIKTLPQGWHGNFDIKLLCIIWIQTTPILVR